MCDLATVPCCEGRNPRVAADMHRRWKIGEAEMVRAGVLMAAEEILAAVRRMVNGNCEAMVGCLWFLDL